MYSHVLVGTDGSDTATRAVEAAARLAKTHGGRLTIVHAFKAKNPVRDERFRDLWWRFNAGSIADEIVRRAERRAQAAVGGGLNIDTCHQPGRTVSVLRRFIDGLKPDAVVVGHGDAHRMRIHRRVGPSLVRKVRSDVVLVDTATAA